MGKEHHFIFVCFFSLCPFSLGFGFVGNQSFDRVVPKRYIDSLACVCG